MLMREALDGYLFHRAPAQRLTERAIVDDLAVAGMDAVVCEADSRRDQACAQRRLLATDQESVARQHTRTAAHRDASHQFRGGFLERIRLRQV